jgi:succinate dehydrogenase/fumarate reductase flavoprotein subunit
MMEILSTDVLVLGAGAAGIRAAMAACGRDANVMMVAAEKVTYGGSTFSNISKGWGIQALVGTERTHKNLEEFYNDIIRVGLGRCDQKLVRILVEESGPRTDDLISYGLRFKKDKNGEYLRMKGCFSEAKRAFLTEDFGNIKQTFLSILRQLRVRIVTGVATDLILEDGLCRGAWIALKSGDIIQINAKSTILATGGGGAIFMDHLGNGGGVGDGYALAHLAGAELKNMEFIQFALGLKNKGKRKFLSIAELDKPGKIKNSNGCDILTRYLPDDKHRDEVFKKRQKHMPFSCRDSSALVDIAIAEALGPDGKVYWQDGNSKDDRFEVTHFAHAFNGGIKINEKAESSVPGLYAAGEVAAGSYGADRIGGCMMTATQVFGKRAGQYAADSAKRLKSLSMPGNSERLGGTCNPYIISRRNDESLLTLEQSLREKMQKHVMILRSQKSLHSCLNYLTSADRYLEDLKFKGALSRVNYAKIRNMIATGKLVAESALARTESKGSHFREDFPNM